MGFSFSYQDIFSSVKADRDNMWREETIVIPKEKLHFERIMQLQKIIEVRYEREIKDKAMELQEKEIRKYFDVLEAED